MNDEFSPYAPPQSSSLEVESDFLDSHKASLSRRFVNMLVDLAGYMLLAVGSMIVMIEFELEWVDTPWFDFVIGYPVYIAYYAFFEGVTGRTPGKLITGTRVVDANGNKPGFGKTLLRTLARFIPFEAFSFFRDCQQGWHDTLTKTHVVRNKLPKEKS